MVVVNIRAGNHHVVDAFIHTDYFPTSAKKNPHFTDAESEAPRG